MNKFINKELETSSEESDEETFYGEQMKTKYHDSTFKDIILTITHWIAANQNIFIVLKLFKTWARS